MKKSKPCATRVPMYEENPDRRIHCPEWSLHKAHYERLTEVAHSNNISKSRAFETIMQNFFLIEKPRLELEGSVPMEAEKRTVRKLTLHPSVIELIRTFATASNVNASRYINEAMEIYFVKHRGEMDLRRLIGLM